MHNPFLIGTRIYLRPLEPEDIPTLTGWTTSPEVRTALELFYRPLERPAQELFLEGIKNNEHDVALGIVEKETDALLGFVGLNHIDQENRQVKLGLFVGEQDERSEKDAAEAIGLMKQYVFEAIDMNRLWLYVAASDARTITMFKQGGFTCEAILKQDRSCHGRYYDTVVMGEVREKERGRKGGSLYWPPERGGDMTSKAKESNF